VGSVEAAAEIHTMGTCSRAIPQARVEMTARLDQAAPGGASAREARHESDPPGSRRLAHDDPDIDLDVPELMPRGEATTERP
jgi:hypothetical protein